MGELVTSKVMSAAESTAVTIVDKMRTFREFLPEFLHDDLEWCINEIRKGQIYSGGYAELEGEDETLCELMSILKDYDDSAEQK